MCTTLEHVQQGAAEVVRGADKIGESVSNEAYTSHTGLGVGRVSP